VHDEVGALVHGRVGGPERPGVAVAEAGAEVLAADERRVADDELGRGPLGPTRVAVVVGLDAGAVRPRPGDRPAARVAGQHLVGLEHGVLDDDVPEGLQDGIVGHAAAGAQMPLQMTDPQHQFGDGRGARVDLQPEDLVRVDRVALEPR